MIEWLKKLRQYLLTGVSYVIPCIACGGILIAASLALAPKGKDNAPDPSQVPFLALMFEVGATAFKLSMPILAGFIAHAMAGKPGLVPGLIGGYLASGFPAKLIFDAQGLASRGLTADKEIVAGFLGAIVIGLIAGGIVNLIKKVPAPKYIKPIMPILIIPIVSSAIVAALMFEVVGVPIANLMASLRDGLLSLNAGSKVVLALILGAMIAFDMGGPVNKAAFFFGAAMIKEQNFAVMGACAAAICTPPLGMGLATLIRRKLWTDEERESGLAALAMGTIGITEGAIPFAAGDPLRVIPCIMLGSMVASTIAMLRGVGDHAPHGGPIVMFLGQVDHWISFTIAIVAGTAVTAVAINFVKSLTRKPAEELAEVSA